MDKLVSFDTENDMLKLREGIKNKYREYCERDRDRYPAFEFNSNRANYQPLRESFEEEFFELRKIDRINNHLHIPSLNTLAQLFSNDEYVPGRKILNTCRSYAEGKPETTIMPAASAAIPAPTSTLNQNRQWLMVILAGLALLVGIKMYYPLVGEATTPSKLSMAQPTNRVAVVREVFAEGTVADANTVWIVIRAKDGLKYWVQPPIQVNSDGTWKGPIYIGSRDKGDIGVTSQIRAFVNPAKALTEGEVLYAWPEAELATKAIEVTRVEELAQ